MTEVVEGLLRVLEMARDMKRAKLEGHVAHGGELQVQELMTLLLISKGGEDGREWRPILQRDIQQRVGASTATMSRIIARLSNGAKGTSAPGLGLIEKRNSPENESINELRLTSKGKALVSKFNDAFA